MMLSRIHFEIILRTYNSLYIPNYEFVTSAELLNINIACRVVGCTKYGNYIIPCTRSLTSVNSLRIRALR